MKVHDISGTPLVKRYGVRGARMFVRIWFPVVYALIVLLLLLFFFLGSELARGWRGILLGGFVSVLAVIAIAVLTRMRLEFLASIDALETAQSEGSPPLRQ
jgi:hypothetical protein